MFRQGFSSEASGIWRSGSIAVPGASHRAGSSSPFHRSAALLFPAEDNLGTGFLHPAMDTLPGRPCRVDGTNPPMSCQVLVSPQRASGPAMAKPRNVGHRDGETKRPRPTRSKHIWILDPRDSTKGCSWVSAAPCHGHGSEWPPAAEDILASY